MTIKAKFTTAGMTKNKLYDVIENVIDILIGKPMRFLFM